MQSELKHCCQSNYHGRGLRPCDVTLRSARFEKGGNDFSRLKKKHWVDLFVSLKGGCVHTLPTHISVQTTCKSACSII